MEKVFTTQARYAQGKDVFKTGLSHVLALVNRLLLLCNSIVYDLVGKDLEEILVAAGALFIAKVSMVKLRTKKLVV